MNIVIDSPGIWRGPRPVSRDDVLWLQQQGVASIINLQSDVFEEEDIEMEQLRVQSVRKNLGVLLAFFHLPMSVVWPPSGAQIREAVRAILNARKYGTVYIHCHDGVDRTGCVLWAYDVWVRGRPIYEAYSEMIDDGYHLWRYFWWLPFVARTIREGL